MLMAHLMYQTGEPRSTMMMTIFGLALSKSISCGTSTLTFHLDSRQADIQDPGTLLLF